MTDIVCTLKCGLSPTCKREIAAEASKGEAKPSSPVRTVTRKEIVPGYYGPANRMHVYEMLEGYGFKITSGDCEPFCIREFARLLNEIADAMEDGE